MSKSVQTFDGYCDNYVVCSIIERMGMAAILRAPKQLCCFVCFNALFITYFLHNVDATISYDRKELLDIRTAITHLELDKDFFFNESDAKDIMFLPDKPQIPSA